MRNAHVSGRAAYDRLVAEAEADHEAYWAPAGARVHRLEDALHAGARPAADAPFFKWFEDGTLNASYNCLDRNIERGLGEKTAIIFEADDGAVTQRDLRATCWSASAAPPTRCARSACRRATASSSTCRCRSTAWWRCRPARASAPSIRWSSAASRRRRCATASPTPARWLVLTADQQVRGGKHLPLKAIVDEALALGGCDSVRHVLVTRRTGGAVPFQAPRDLWMADLLAAQPPTLRTRMGERRASAVPALHLGLHRQAQGRAALDRRLPAACGADLQVDLRPQARGRLLVHRRHRLGHRPHLHRLRPAGARRHPGGVRRRAHLPGRRPLLEDDPGPPGHACSTPRPRPSARSSRPPKARRRRTRATTTCRSLRILGSVGEPINPAAWEWYHQHIGGGRCPIVDTFWQTETGGHMITPLPGVHDLVPGSCSLPFPGIAADVVDEAGNDAALGPGRHPGREEALALDDPHHLGRPRALQVQLLPAGLPGPLLPRRRRRDPRRATGNFTITGRIDDVLNVSGHRMGTMEIESALVSCTDAGGRGRRGGPARRHHGRGDLRLRGAQGPAARRRGGPAIAGELRAWVGQGDRPDRQAARTSASRENLPKTRSGKIMRRLLRSRGQGGDGRRRTRRRWRTRRSWSSWARPTAAGTSWPRPRPAPRPPAGSATPRPPC